jgi:hypothetical protein
LSAKATRHHYERDLGIELRMIRLLANDEALRGAEDRKRTDDALRDVFASRVSVTRPLRIAVDEAATSVVDIEQTLEQARTAVKDSSLSEESYRAFEHFQSRRDLAFCAEQLFLSGVQTLNAEQFQLAEPTIGGAQSTQRWAIQEQDKLRAYLDPFDALVARRLGLGVIKLQRQGQGDEAGALALAITMLAEAVPFAIDVRRFLMAVAFLEEVTPALGTSSFLRDRMAGLNSDIDRCKSRALELIGKTPPLAGELHDRWQRLLSDARNIPPADFMQQLLQLYWACLSRLARLVIDA